MVAVLFIPKSREFDYGFQAVRIRVMACPPYADFTLFFRDNFLLR
jgi:hypothetical protein